MEFNTPSPFSNSVFIDATVWVEDVRHELTDEVTTLLRVLYLPSPSLFKVVFV